MSIRSLSSLVFESVRGIRLSIHNLSFLVLGVVSMVLQGIGNALIVISIDARGPLEEVGLGVGITLAILAPVLMAIGGSIYCAGKNRTAWLGLLGLLSPLGLLFLAVLEDRTVQPNRDGAHSS